MVQRILTAVLALIVLSQAGTGSLDGTIVRMGTSDPVAGVNVEMRRVEGTPESPLLPRVYPGGTFSQGAIVVPNAPNPGDSFYAQTGSDGHFSFTGLKPGKYRLLAAHPAGLYYPAEYGQRNPRGPGYDFSVQVGQTMKARMEMAPMASVSGRIFGPDGKPAAHVHVFAAEIAYQNGERVLNQMQGADSDDLGNYRLFWLPPGKYVIGAIPEGLRRRQMTIPFGPPAAVESMNQTFSEPLIEYQTDVRGEVVENVYQPVYAPGDVNPAHARIFDLRLGASESGIDFSYAPGRQRAVRVRGTVIDNTTGQPAGNATVRAVPRANDPVTVSPLVTTDKSGAFDMDGLARGEYFLVATIMAENNDRRLAVQPLNIQTSNTDGLKLIATGGMEIPGQIRIDNGTADGFRVSFAPEFRNLPGPAVTAVSNDGFSVRRLLPGNFRVSVAMPDMASPSIYVKSIQIAGVEAVDGFVHIDGTTAGPLQIALGRNGGSIEGLVADNQRQPVPNVQVVLVPMFASRPDLFKTSSTDLSGNFRIQGIAPGSYLAYAWPWVPNGIWQNVDFLRSVERLGQRLSISEGQNANANLAFLPDPN